VDLVTAYSKRPDLADSLVRAVQQIERARDRASGQTVSVRSTAKSGRQWRVADRLADADIRVLVAAFERGTPKWKLAEQYGISESSVKRLVRKHRAAQLIPRA
jgi:predicted DNA binding protein